MDPTEHQWCPEIVDIMAKYGQKPEDFIVSDDEDETDIQGSDGEQFPTNDLENTHYYATKTEKEQLPMLKIKIRGFQAGCKPEKVLFRVVFPFKWCEAHFSHTQHEGRLG